MKFVMYKLYNDIGMSYPPNISESAETLGVGLDALLAQLDSNGVKQESEEEDVHKMETEQRIETLNVNELVRLDQEKDSDDEAPGEVPEDLDMSKVKEEEGDEVFLREKTNLEKQGRVFEGLKFFLSREVPRDVFVFFLRAFGAEVSHEGPEAPFDISDEGITHHILDKDMPKRKHLDRVYVQPQWVFDSANEGVLLPEFEYAPGAKLPPHLSPFQNVKFKSYTPHRRLELDKVKEAVANGEVYVPQPFALPENQPKVIWTDEAEMTKEEKYAGEIAAEAAGQTYAEKVAAEEGQPTIIRKPKKKFEREVASLSNVLNFKDRKAFKSITKRHAKGAKTAFNLKKKSYAIARKEVQNNKKEE